jgi:hypothetical protein
LKRTGCKYTQYHAAVQINTAFPMSIT